MSDLEIGLTVTITGLVVGFIIDVFYKKAKRNQERIDDAVVESVKESEKKIISLEKEIQALQYKVLNLQEAERRTNKQWEENLGTMRQVNDTIIAFKDSMKIWHHDMSTQNAEIKQSMDRSNQLVESSQRINSELMGVLKDLKNK